MYNETGLNMPEVYLLTLWTRAEKWSREDEGELLHDCMKDPAIKAHYLEQAEKWERLQAWYRTDPKAFATPATPATEPEDLKRGEA